MAFLASGLTLLIREEPIASRPAAAAPAPPAAATS
jgi:hypothetical protein